jgi:hypothetical protein
MRTCAMIAGVPRGTCSRASAIFLDRHEDVDDAASAYRYSANEVGRRQGGIAYSGFDVRS